MKSESKRALPRRKLADLLKMEFQDIQDPVYLQTMGELDFSDKLAVAYPAVKKGSLQSKPLLERANIFYYLHLSPFARRSMGQTYVPSSLRT